MDHNIDPEVGQRGLESAAMLTTCASVAACAVVRRAPLSRGREL